VSEYREAVWSGVPEEAEPEDFGARRDWLLARVAPGEHVLDAGCGDGTFAAALAEHGARVVGVDVALEALRRARDRHPGLDLRLTPEGGPLPLDAQSVDVVWAGEVIEHVLDTPGFLAELRRVLRFGGRLLLTTPDHPLALRLRLALSARAFEAHFDPRVDHLRFYTGRSLTAVLRDHGFDDVRIERRGRRLYATAS
jgi:2-polyprenyl-6-hydroxyphenyl methylase/3-demethylubiquinone-9 3-methyltransferase